MSKKTIPISKLRLGMFIHELKGSWIEHPFWKKAFLLEATEDLTKLKESPIKYVVIDTSKGLDLAVEASHSSANAMASSGVAANSTPEKSALQSPKKPGRSQTRVSAADERLRAKRIISTSKDIVSAMLQEARMGKAINTEAAIPLVEGIASSLERNESALISLVRLKSQDNYTYLHSVAVCALMIATAKQLNLNDSEVKQAGLAGLVHDLGKVAIPLDILNKPSTLSVDEFNVVKEHPVKGYEILLKSNFFDAVALDVCLHHHEKIDGTGYPHGLKADEISLFAKMGAVCDVYDAITSDRPYKNGWEPGVALQRMANWKSQFDDVVFKAFVKSVGIYPVGSTVILKSGRLAVVIDQSPKSLLSPIVKVFFSTKSKLRIPVEVVDLSKSNAAEKIVGHEDPALWGITDLTQLWAAD